MEDIKPQQVLKAVQAIEERGAGEIARRSLQMCSQIFRYAIATSRCEHDPTQALKGALEPTQKGHYSSLEIEELPELVKSLERNTARLFIPTIHAIKLMMLTFVRTGELIEATWDEFNFKTGLWIIPQERMKMKRQHIVPLSRQTIELFYEASSVLAEHAYGAGWKVEFFTAPRGQDFNDVLIQQKKGVIS